MVVVKLRVLGEVTHIQVLTGTPALLGSGTRIHDSIVGTTANVVAASVQVLVLIHDQQVKL